MEFEINTIQYNTDGRLRHIATSWMAVGFIPHEVNEYNSMYLSLPSAP
jgi:hypothetical protein